MGYESTVVVAGADNVQRRFDRFEDDPTAAMLQRGSATYQAAAVGTLVTDGGADKSSTDTAVAFDASMVTRTSVAHFVDFVTDQGNVKLLRVTPKFVGNINGHLVALGPGGFCLCTCLEILIKGLPCRHGILALLETEVVFNGACVAPRWRTDATEWSMGVIASKPAKLTLAGEGSSARQDPVAPGPNFLHTFKRNRAVAELCQLHSIRQGARIHCRRGQQYRGGRSHPAQREEDCSGWHRCGRGLAAQCRENDCLQGGCFGNNRPRERGHYSEGGGREWTTNSRRHRTRKGTWEGRSARRHHRREGSRVRVRVVGSQLAGAGKPERIASGRSDTNALRGRAGQAGWQLGKPRADGGG